MRAEKGGQALRKWRAPQGATQLMLSGLGRKKKAAHLSGRCRHASTAKQNLVCLYLVLGECQLHARGIAVINAVREQRKGQLQAVDRAILDLHVQVHHTSAARGSVVAYVAGQHKSLV